VDTATFEIATDITETPIQHARKRALSGQQIQAEKLMRNTKRKLSELSVGNNVIIPIPQYDNQLNIIIRIVRIYYLNNWCFLTIGGDFSGN
jgi:hypothetical protein